MYSAVSVPFHLSVLLLSALCTISGVSLGPQAEHECSPTCALHADDTLYVLQATPFSAGAALDSHLKPQRS